MSLFDDGSSNCGVTTFFKGGIDYIAGQPIYRTRLSLTIVTLSLQLAQP